jgi:hypothetical protein
MEFEAFEGSGERPNASDLLPVASKLHRASPATY